MLESPGVPATGYSDHVILRDRFTAAPSAARCQGNQEQQEESLERPSLPPIILQPSDQHNPENRDREECSKLLLVRS